MPKPMTRADEILTQAFIDGLSRKSGIPSDRPRELMLFALRNYCVEYRNGVPVSEIEGNLTWEWPDDLLVPPA
jgi:hypothetical protein